MKKSLFKSILSLSLAGMISLPLVAYGKPIADGIDNVDSNTTTYSEVILEDGEVITRASRTYNASEFSVGVYLSGAPFLMNRRGTAEFSGANQHAIEPRDRADVSYQVLDYYTGRVYGTNRRTGNNTNMNFNATSQVQANIEVDIYLANIAGVPTSASGTFTW